MLDKQSGNPNIKYYIKIAGGGGDGPTMGPKELPINMNRRNKTHQQPATPRPKETTNEQ